MQTRIKRQVMQIMVDYLDGRTTVAEAGKIADGITEDIVTKINDNHAVFSLAEAVRQQEVDALNDTYFNHIKPAASEQCKKGPGWAV